MVLVLVQAWVQGHKQLSAIRSPVYPGYPVHIAYNKLHHGDWARFAHA